MEKKPQKQKRGMIARVADSPLGAKILYGIVAGILIITAIVIGIVSAGNRSKTPVIPSEQQGGSNEGEGPSGGEDTEQKPPVSEEPKEDKPDAGKEQTPTFVSPVVGRVIKSHSDSVPVYSLTLEDYRTHNGLDISTDEGAKVYAAAAGTVTKLYKDPLLGYAVELTHNDNFKTVYCNLTKDCLTALTVGQKIAAGTLIGNVGDSSISELCDEPHLHFELLVNDKSVNPLDYITEASQKASLGIEQKSL